MSDSLTSLKMEGESLQISGNFLMTVEQGSFSSIDMLQRAISSSGKNIGRIAAEILSKIEISPKIVERDIWEMSGFDLGFRTAVPKNVLYKRAIEKGFATYPLEVVSLLRLHCNDEKWRLGGTKPASASDGYVYLFNLSSHGGDMWLHANHDFPDRLWYPEDVWTFELPRKPSV